MATGAYDTEGIWIYGEDDPASPFSDTLNLLAESTSVEIANDRARMSSVESTIDTMQEPPVFRAYPASDSVVVTNDERGPGSSTVDFAGGGTWLAPIHSSIRQVPIAGYYRFTAVGRFAGTPNDGVLQMTLRKNSTSSVDPNTGDLLATTLSTTRGDNEDTTVIVTAMALFAAGDSFQMGVIQQTGADLTWVGNQPHASYIEAEFLRAA